MSHDFADVRRVTRSKSEAQAAYDRMSGFYDLITDPFEGKYRRMGLRALNPRPGERVLEIGPGPGQALAAIAGKVGSSGSVFGLDISMKMLRRGHRHLEDQAVTDRVELQQGDGASLPYRDHAFQAAFISFTLELFDTPDIQKVLQELHRVLVEDGRVVVVSMAKRKQSNAMTRLYLFFHDAFPNYADCRPIWVQQDLESAGFKIKERVDFSMFGLPGAFILAECN